MKKNALDLPPVYLVLSLAAMAVLHFGLPIAQPIGEPYRYAGTVLIALAGALGAWAVILFRRARTGVVPFSNATTLVLRGPYRFTRNPMYLGMTGVLVGAAVSLGSITPWLVVPAFMRIISERFIIPEEAFLERTFGRAYLDYKAAVRRWL
ncbi:MAG TPA: isoprenylcysteine carboxylmethyltransferase family protein [Burkholderiales bacterium]|nr:isoprenylcysteine carboxylmethyltransferase family protein [Burkholderiales bacterium]